MHPLAESLRPGVLLTRICRQVQESCESLQLSGSRQLIYELQSLGIVLH